MEKIGILGYGEIGKSLYGVYEKNKIKCFIKDKTDPNLPEDLDILNICLPFSKQFTSLVKKHIQLTNAKLTIIHSTLPVGTTQSLIEDLPNTLIVHSPVRGNHPNLTKSIFTFTKYIGSSNKTANNKTKTHFKSLGITTKILKNSNSSELLKLLCTSYYGICIAWHNTIEKACKKFDVPFNEVVDWNLSYNKGYQKLKQSHFTRPILTPPKNKKIGGHCVIPNAELLNFQFEDELLKYILTFK
jgi:UDP-N-acetyl-D-mannosaminuronate dehydrogenase